MPRRPLTPSHRIDAVPQAMSIYINQLVYQMKRKGMDIIALSLGEAYFDLPELDWQGIDIQAGYHYSDSQGLPALRDKISDYYRRRYDANVSADNVLISCGSKPLIYICMLCTTEPGDQVLIHEPGWLSYTEQAKLAQLNAGYIPFDTPVEDFGHYFGADTRLLIINNPNNPAGRLYSREELTSLYRQCQTHGVFLLVDEAYSDFVDGPFPSLWSLNEDRCGMLVVNSLSKNFGMSGWRIGYVLAQPDLIDALLKANQHLITCAPTPLVQYVAHHFEDLVERTAPQIAAVVAKRRRIKASIQELGLSVMPGDCTFYFFLDVSAYPHGTMTLVLDLLVNHQVAVVPGDAYGDSTGHFVRLSIGTASEAQIIATLALIKDKLRPDCPRPDLAGRLQELGLPAWEM